VCDTDNPESHLDVSNNAGKRIQAVMNRAHSE